MHPIEELRGERSNKLKGKRIVLCITGSIAAVESFYLCRELIRDGADVIPVMSEAATRILHPDSMEFASGRRPILSLTGAVEHVSLGGDLILVSPCTANTLSKAVLGIPDNPVTCCVVAGERAGVPIILVPAMHLSMYKNPGFVRNLKEAKERFEVIEPSIEHERLKIASIEEIVGRVRRTLGKKDFDGKSVLIIGGASVESVDDIRILTNRSSGKMGISLAIEAFERGADVEFWCARVSERIPKYLRTRRYESVNELLNLLKSSSPDRFKIVIVCAALSNYIPKKYKGKIPSAIENLKIELSKAPCILTEIRKKCPKSKIVAFKAEERREGIEKKAMDFMKRKEVDMVVANTLSIFGADRGEVWILDKKILRVEGDKGYLAERILSRVKELWR